MGQAKRRGTYEQRKKEGEVKTMAVLVERQISLEQLEKERKEAWNKLSAEAKAMALLSVGVSFEVLVNMGLLTMDDVDRDETVEDVLLTNPEIAEKARNRLYGVPDDEIQEIDVDEFNNIIIF